MAYIRKLIAHDEKMIGIARLHWIYVLKGIAWFLTLAGAGWFLNSAMNTMLLTLGETTNAIRMTSALVDISNGLMYFLMGGGLLIFLSFVVDVLVTEIGLSDKRIMHKTGLIFVKVKQIDIEEIRGENLDLGWFGRFLNYGYVMLDCRFIGDVRLPAIENPERFLRALHTARIEAQDALNLVMGKSNVRIPLNVTEEESQGMQPKTPKPEIQPGQPATQPEVQPDQTPSRPEIEPEPTPHAPPPPSTPPAQPGVVPPPVQPTPNPGPNPLPPLQNPTALDPNAVAQVVAQVTPQIAAQVVEQLKEQGVLNKPAPENDNDEDIDNDLIAVFDDARFKDEDPHERHNKLEHAIH